MDNIDKQADMYNVTTTAEARSNPHLLRGTIAPKTVGTGRIKAKFVPDLPVGSVIENEGTETPRVLDDFQGSFETSLRLKSVMDGS